MTLILRRLMQVTHKNTVKNEYMLLYGKMSTKCLFCKICSKEASADILYEDDEIMIFKDIKPSAKHHFLAVPKGHIDNINSLTFEHKILVEKLVDVSKSVLREQGGDVDDIRLGFHCPPFNSISHLHLHVISPVTEMSFMSRLIFKPNTYWFATSDYVLQKIEASKL